MLYSCMFLRETVSLQLGNFREKEMEKVLHMRATDYFKKGERKDTSNQRV